MHIAALLTVLAFVVGSVTPASADDRPDDPFGNHTKELKSEALLFATWEFLREQVTLDKTKFLSCIEQHPSSCPEVSTIMQIVEEARQHQGKALLAHLRAHPGSLDS